VGRPRTPRGRGKLVIERLAEEYPVITIPLNHGSAFQLLVATILSAQCTDERVNQVTPILFARFPDAPAMADADPAEVEDIIRPTGFFRAKTASLIGMARAVVGRFGGEVPGRMEDLVTLPGVGRKTANVILGHCFGVPGVVVDTHVLRLSRLLGLTDATDPERVERDLMAIWPRRAWSDTTMRLIYHGRRVCVARRPRCRECVMADFCPSASTGPPPPRRSRRPAAATRPG
jgi:endonuclease-3